MRDSHKGRFIFKKLKRKKFKKLFRWNFSNKWTRFHKVRFDKYFNVYFCVLECLEKFFLWGLNVENANAVRFLWREQRASEARHANYVLWLSKGRKGLKCRSAETSNNFSSQIRMSFPNMKWNKLIMHISSYHVYSK